MLEPETIAMETRRIAERLKDKEVKIKAGSHNNSTVRIEAEMAPKGASQSCGWDSRIFAPPTPPSPPTLPPLPPGLAF